MDPHAPHVCAERQRRIRLSYAALAYERYDDPTMSDAEFDDLARQIDPSIDTGNPALDAFFRTEFKPNTGSWIHRHPELDKVDAGLRRWKPEIGR